MIPAQPAVRDPPADQRAAMPSITVVAPTVRLAVAIDMPAKRRKNSGTHQEIPPMAKVSVASPKVAVKNAGLRIIPNTVARFGLAFDVIACTPLRLAPDPAVQRGDEETRQRANEERRAPPPMRADLPSGQVAERRANRNGEIEHRKHRDCARALDKSPEARPARRCRT